MFCYVGIFRFGEDAVRTTISSAILVSSLVLAVRLIMPKLIRSIDDDQNSSPDKVERALLQLMEVC